jgi:hypothetical protein
MTMPLPFCVTQALDVPPADFNAHGLAVVDIRGGRYGGDWVVSAVIAGRQPDEVIGRIDTEAGGRRDHLTSDPQYPDRAIETAFVWLNDETRRRGWRLVSCECANQGIPAHQAPYFCAARVIIASETFVPAPGVTYADELTLDHWMGYVA